MTLPSKNFDALPEQDSTPSCEFELGGRKWHCRNARELPANTMDEALRPDGFLARSDDFFKMVIVPDEVDEFMALATSASSPLTVSNVSPLMDWITQQITKRPTKRPSSLAGGPRRTNPKSVGRSSSRVTAKRR